MNFKEFLESAHQKELHNDIEDTLKNIPKKHRDLIADYKIKSQGSNTLNNDKKYVGEIDEKKKHIKIAAPWNYSREMTYLHELAHAVFRFVMTPELKKEWKELLKKTKKEQKDKIKDKNSLDQNDEELFAMAYSTTYAKHPPKTYAHDAWLNFIKALPK